VHLVRDTSVDHLRRLSGRVGCLCAAQGIQALLSRRHRRVGPRHSPLCHGSIERIICTGHRRRAVDRRRHERGLWERPRGPGQSAVQWTSARRQMGGCGSSGKAKRQLNVTLTAGGEPTDIGRREEEQVLKDVIDATSAAEAAAHQSEGGAGEGRAKRVRKAPKQFGED